MTRTILKFFQFSSEMSIYIVVKDTKLNQLERSTGVVIQKSGSLPHKNRCTPVLGKTEDTRTDGGNGYAFKFFSMASASMLLIAFFNL